MSSVAGGCGPSGEDRFEVDPNASAPQSQDFDNRGEPQADHACCVCSGSLIGEDSDHFLRELFTERARQDE
jgi:hypothetical protein